MTNLKSLLVGAVLGAALATAAPAMSGMIAYHTALDALNEVRALQKHLGLNCTQRHTCVPVGARK